MYFQVDVCVCQCTWRLENNLRLSCSGIIHLLTYIWSLITWVTPGTWWALLAHCWGLKYILPFSTFLHGLGRIKLRASHGMKQVLSQLNPLSSEASISEGETMNYLLQQLLKRAFLTNLFHSVLLGQKSRFPLPPLEERPLTFPPCFYPSPHSKQHCHCGWEQFVLVFTS